MSSNKGSFWCVDFHAILWLDYTPFFSCTTSSDGMSHKNNYMNFKFDFRTKKVHKRELSTISIELNKKQNKNPMWFKQASEFITDV